MTKQKPEWSMNARAFWPLAALFSGFFVYYLLFEFIYDPFTPKVDMLVRGDIQFRWNAADADAMREAGLAADLNARYRFAVASILLLLACIASFIAAMRLVLAPFGLISYLVAFAAAALGAVIGYFEQWSLALRYAAADCKPGSGRLDCPLSRAAVEAPEGWSFNSAVLEHAQMVVDLNSSFGVGAIGVLVICVVFLCRNDMPDFLSPEGLRWRRRGLRVVLGCAALVLVFSVATTHGYYNWAGSLMTGPSAAAQTEIASAAASYWGSVFTIVLIVAISPVAICLFLDVQLAAERAFPDGPHQARVAWLKQEGLATGIGPGVGALLAAAGPALTGPTLDILRAIATGV